VLEGESRLQLPDRPAGLADAAVAGWRERVTIDSYLPEPPDRYPAYLDRRVYQGSSGRVYPLPFHDRISPTSAPVEWDAVHLENRWLRFMVLPELGGRIHVGFDRCAGYDFFYRNGVIKPALVGLAGPWIAGGVEFNWPQHHRPATFLPADVEIEQEPDGSVTVWCSDHDPFARMKGMHGIRLRPDRASVELRVRLYNRTDQTQTFLWWANVAARVHDAYQAFFPRDVRAVADHAKRAVTAFPAADRPYYGIDYPARRAGGGDRLDWYRNIPVPTSYMCVGSREGFFGGYDHAAHAGFVHVADPYTAVGKKQWTWGNAAFGHAWDRNLGDDGAAYVELMAGVFTDNQPDFSFLAPGETKVFSQVWYPIQEIGPVHAATVDAAVRVDVEPDGMLVGLAVTAERPGCRLRLEDAAGGVLAETVADVAPGAPHRGRITVGVPGRLVLRVLHGDAELVAWDSRVPDAPDVVPATEPPAPSDVTSVERLALIGAHLEQYRHATRSPEPYWREALRRDPGHVASSVGLAARAYRRGELAEAELLLATAVDRLTALNANPADTTALYALGLVLERQGRPDEAYARHAAASWARAWRAAAGYRMARLDAAAGRDAAALDRLADVRRVEPEHLQARALTALLLGRTGRPVEAAVLVRDTLALDPLDWWTRDLAGLPLTTDAQTCLDVALEYAGVGEPEEALRVLDVAVQREAHRVQGQTAAGPLLGYHRADLLERLGRPEAASAARERARTADATWCFPSRLDDVAVLERATTADPADARALALLGHWRYAAGRADDAIAAWRTSAALDPSDPVVWRNLGVAAWNHLGDADAARAAYDRALAAAGGTDARLVFESDQLDARRGVPPEHRLDRLLDVRGLVETRDDATVALAHLLLTAGRLEEARSLLLGRRFQPWEGGEGEVLRAWDRLCRLAAARPAGSAVAALDAALDPPSSLGEARHPLASSAALQLLRGDALAAAGDVDAARAAWQLAAQDGDFLAMSADPHSEATYSSVLALRRLGRDTEARRRTESLRAWVGTYEAAQAAVDYFATSLPSMLLFTEDPALARRRRVMFLRAQLDMLDGAPERARERLDALLAEDPHHLDALELSAALPHPDAVPQRSGGTRR
jgi:tetratricopeptide (TPR) repeat protein